METPKVRVRVAPLTGKEKTEALMRLHEAQMEICNDFKDQAIKIMFNNFDQRIKQYNNIK